MPLSISGAGYMADNDVSLDDLIAIERVAQELWAQANKRTPDQWRSYPSSPGGRGADARKWRS